MQLFSLLDSFHQNPPYCRILTRAELFIIYQRQTLKPQVRRAGFYSLFKSQFGPKRVNKRNPRIRISKYTSHSRCDLCVTLQEGRKLAKTSADLARIRKLTEDHRNEYSSSRIEINRQMELCQSQPREWMGMMFDDMDNKKSYLPKMTENSKKFVGMNRIKTKITGCIMNSGLYGGNRKCHFMTNHDQFENGSNKVVTIVYKLIWIFYRDHSFLPPRLTIQTDNCWHLVFN